MEELERLVSALSCSNVCYKRFEGRSHFIAGEKGWEEVADYVLAWMAKLN